MKKVFSIFTLLTLAATIGASAQVTNTTDSVKQLSTLSTVIADSTKAVTENVKAATDPTIVANTENAKRRYSAAINARTTIGIYQKKKAIVDTTTQPFASTPDIDLQATLLDKINVNVDEIEGQFTTIAADSLRSRIPQKMPSTVTALKKQLPLISNDTLRAAYYQKIADHFLSYDSISIRRTKQYYQDAALEFTMKALHSYSRYSDATGLVTSYNNLSKVYRDQKKYAQAKWFILQSNTISRNLKDQPNIVNSLVALANIKMDIRDYSLAMRDLNEALTITTQNHYTKQELDVQESFVALYTHLDNPKKAAIASKRRDAINDSLLKAAVAQRVAAYKTQDSTIQAKKKLYTSVNSESKRNSKVSSSKKTVSL